MTHNRKHLLPALGCCLLAAAALWLLFCFDNKYTARAPLAQDGALILETGALERGTLAVPVDGWQLWPDALLAPGQLGAGAPAPVDTYIGQFLTLRPYHADGSPYGAATWRVRLRADRPVEVCMLIPEAYCASAVYVDGELAGGHRLGLALRAPCGGRALRLPGGRRGRGGGPDGQFHPLRLRPHLSAGGGRPRRGGALCGAAHDPLRPAVLCLAGRGSVLGHRVAAPPKPRPAVSVVWGAVPGVCAAGVLPLLPGGGGPPDPPALRA